MLQLEFPYGQQAQQTENVAASVWPAKGSAFFTPTNHRIKERPSRFYAEGDYYLFVGNVGSVVHHWMLISKQLYPRELNQFTFTLAGYLRSEDNLEGVVMEEFPDAQSTIRWLNIMAMEHGFGCETSHRGDEITLDGRSCTVIHYVNVTIEDFDAASKGFSWNPCRYEV
jgi:hypothetical protein